VSGQIKKVEVVKRSSAAEKAHLRLLCVV